MFFIMYQKEILKISKKITTSYDRKHMPFMATLFINISLSVLCYSFSLNMYAGCNSSHMSSGHEEPLPQKKYLFRSPKNLKIPSQTELYPFSPPDTDTSSTNNICYELITLFNSSIPNIYLERKYSMSPHHQQSCFCLTQAFKQEWNPISSNFSFAKINKEDHHKELNSYLGKYWISLGDNLNHIFYRLIANGLYYFIHDPENLLTNHNFTTDDTSVVHINIGSLPIDEASWTNLIRIIKQIQKGPIRIGFIDAVDWDYNNTITAQLLILPSKPASWNPWFNQLITLYTSKESQSSKHSVDEIEPLIETPAVTIPQDLWEFPTALYLKINSNNQLVCHRIRGLNRGKNNPFELVIDSMPFNMEQQENHTYTSFPKFYTEK
ncbi:hypothetical protein CI610_02144 [invertebrate metagenome]|uniref:Uncharacterized protein n=1 Tax=invertebrate metagenome TaxID=1711999 RepID=A0A2H9T6N9_9ZZZZ